MWDATQEITGAIQWVNDPGVLGFLIAGQPTLFALKPVFRIGFAEVVQNFLFGSDVDFTHEVCSGLGLIADAVHII